MHSVTANIYFNFSRFFQLIKDFIPLFDKLLLYSLLIFFIRFVE